MASSLKDSNSATRNKKKIEINDDEILDDKFISMIRE